MFRPFLTAVLTLFFVNATPSWPVVAFEQATKTTTPQAPKTATPQAPAVPPTSTLPKDDDSVKFLVIGDSGTGDRQQYEVAAKIVEAYAQFPLEFAIMLGDNLCGSERAIDFVHKFEKHGIELPTEIFRQTVALANEARGITGAGGLTR